jgi:hypothetical protein
MANLVSSVSSPCTTSILCGCLAFAFPAVPHFNSRYLRTTCPTSRTSTATRMIPVRHLQHAVRLNPYGYDRCPCASLLKQPPGSRSGLKNPLELLESSWYNNFSRRRRRAWCVVIEVCCARYGSWGVDLESKSLQ